MSCGSISIAEVTRTRVSGVTVWRICPTASASMARTVTCPVKALVDATPISGGNVDVCA